MIGQVFQLRRGTAAENDAYTGAFGELTVDVTTPNLRLHDGTTAGGHVLAFFGAAPAAHAASHGAGGSDIVTAAQIWDGVSQALTVTGIPDGNLFVRSGNNVVGVNALTTYLLNQADQVTNAHLRDSVGVSVIGRAANSTGDPADIAAGADDTLLGRRSGALTWAKISTAEINANAVTDAVIRQGGACSVIGRSANSSGNVADISAGADDRVLMRTSGSLSWAQVGTAQIKDANVTDAKLRDSTACSVIGRSANSTGVPADISFSADESILARRSGAVTSTALSDASIVLTAMVYGF